MWIHTKPEKKQIIEKQRWQKLPKKRKKCEKKLGTLFTIAFSRHHTVFVANKEVSVFTLVETINKEPAKTASIRNKDRMSSFIDWLLNSLVLVNFA